MNVCPRRVVTHESSETPYAERQSCAMQRDGYVGQVHRDDCFGDGITPEPGRSRGEPGVGATAHRMVLICVIHGNLRESDKREDAEDKARGALSSVAVATGGQSHDNLEPDIADGGGHRESGQRGPVLRTGSYGRPAWQTDEPGCDGERTSRCDHATQRDGEKNMGRSNTA